MVIYPDDLRWIDNLYVGQLRPDELKMFERAVQDGRARRIYRGTMGFLGCAEVELIDAHPQD